MFREAPRCYTLPKGDLEEVVTGFPHSSQLIKDKLTTGCTVVYSHTQEIKNMNMYEYEK